MIDDEGLKKASLLKANDLFQKPGLSFIIFQWHMKVFVFCSDTILSWKDTKSKKKLLSEVMSHHTVDQEVDAGVQDWSKVGNMSQALDPLLRKKRFGTNIDTSDNVLEVIELPDVNDRPRSVATDEDDDDAQENHEHVDFLPELSLWSKWFRLEFAEFCYDFQVDGHQSNEGNDDGEDDPAVGGVVLDVVAVQPQLCRFENWNINIFISCCIGR